jgi:hypothetical protein
MKKREPKKPRRGQPMVRLEDLAPRKDPAGGSGKVRFGENAERPATREKPPRS